MWNEQNVARLREMWNDGCSASVIAVELKTSRNAVIGKVSRLALGRHVTRRAIVASYDRPRRSMQRRIAHANRESGEWLSQINTATNSFDQIEHYRSKARKCRQHAERTKSELRAMLAEAVRNTVALQQAA